MRKTNKKILIILLSLMVVLPLVKPINSIKEISKNITKENESYFSFKTNSLKNPLINIYNNDNFIFEAREKIEIPEIIINILSGRIIPVLNKDEEEIMWYS